MHAQNKNGSDTGLNHPSREDCVGFLYGELTEADHGRMTEHFRDCADCRTQFESWRGTMNTLAEYRVPVVRPFRPAAAPHFKWGIAAAFALGLGFALGRLAAPTGADTSSLRASLKSEIVADLRQQQYADNRLFADAITQSEARSNSKLLALRHDLETVAIRTQDSLQQAQEQIVSLATFSPGQSRPQNP